ncbi:GmrSD restriction endonuclease domain-containing protein [Capnocytophaga granulosa]
MATWKPYRISDIVIDIDEEKFVLPVIQRSLVWTEEKMELLYDTVLKGNSFGGIMVIVEEKESRPLFSYRPFTKDGNFIESREVEKLQQQQSFVIDGQQRLQSFYIGLKGSINGKELYFDLFSDYNSLFEFKFEKNEKDLPKTSKEIEDRVITKYFWYPAKELLRMLKDTDDEEIVADEIISNNNIEEKNEKDHIGKNIKAFYKNIISSESLGISKVTINKKLPEIDNRQRIVELFRRLNDGGTKLSSFDLVASILKGFSWEMESFLREMLQDNEDIGLSQENLIKLIFLLQDNYNKEMASIEASDAQFAIDNKDKIKATIIALKKFLKSAHLYEYYKDENRSFIPLFFIAYHLFHKKINNQQLENYFDNFETSNEDFPLIKQWIFHSLLNGVFRSRGAGWIPYRTGIKKILQIIKEYKNQKFPIRELFDVYINHPITFNTDYLTNDNFDKLDDLDSSFIYYLIYGKAIRANDIDHIMPKSILEKKKYDLQDINSIKNFQLLDYGTNRGDKNAKSFFEWISNSKYVKNKKEYLKIHLIPTNEEFWEEKNFKDFIEERRKLIIEKIRQANSSTI